MIVVRHDIIVAVATDSQLRKRLSAVIWTAVGSILIRERVNN